jgi:uncharacterized protein (TIGR02145 family)
MKHKRFVLIGKLLVALWFLMSRLHAQPLYFPPQSPGLWDTLPPSTLGWCPARIDSLYALLDSNDTKAFILLKDGKIVLEKYFAGHSPNTLWRWASAGKTVTATLAGIAQQENLLQITDTTSTYLGPGWSNLTSAQEERINLRHQLTMTTGLDDGVPDLYCTDDTCLTYLVPPGTRWAYHNAPYTLLDPVLENATGRTLNQYLNQKIKTPTGMDGQFIVSGYNRVLFSTARSMARFGLLMLNRGVWNGVPILSDTAYFGQMTRSSQTLNQAYGYLWWLNGTSTHMVPRLRTVFSGPMFPSAPMDMIAALGSEGQFINVIPSTNMIWIRMGETPPSVPVDYLFNNVVWNAINQLICNTPNPASINGTSNYANTSLTSIAYTPVELMDSTGTVVERDTTGINGAFSMTGIQGRRYRIQALPNLVPGGVNATDALRVVQSFSGTTPLNGIQAMAADVNRSGTVTSTDALNIARYSAQLLSAFPAGPWTQDSTWVLADTASSARVHRILSTGDVNASFTPPPPSPCPTTTMTDIAGNLYPTLVIQNQCWMGSNLRTNRFRNGDLIPFPLTTSAWSGTVTTPAQALYNNDPNSDSLWGRLYNWYAVADSRGLCPTGWHVPSDAEWTTLTTSLGGVNLAGHAVKSLSGWASAGNGSNSSGFNGLPAGFRRETGVFEGINNHAYWWSSTGLSLTPANAYYRRASFNASNLFRDNSLKRLGLSVRCVLD